MNVDVYELAASVEFAFAVVHLVQDAPARAFWSGALGVTFLALARLRGRT